MSGRILVILILGFASNLSVALECYVCTGLGAGCQTDFEDTNRECLSSDSPRCYVGRTEVDGSVTTFTRSCLEATACDDGCQEASVGGVTTKGCQECCDTDLCNTGNSGMLFTPIIHLLIGGTVMALAMSAITAK